MNTPARRVRPSLADLLWTASRLGIPTAHVGPCSQGDCSALCHRYGHGGNPLCPRCRTARTTSRRPVPDLRAAA